MKIVSIDVGGVMFTIRSDIKIPHLHDRYLTYQSPSPGKLSCEEKVIINFVLIHNARPKGSSNFSKLEDWIYKNGVPVFSKKKYVSSNLLKSLDFQNFFSAYLNDPLNSLYLSYQPHMVFLRDFLKHEINLFFTNEWGEFGPEIQINHMLRTIFATFSPCFSAFQFHSTAVQVNSQAAMFIGIDNSGKTTVALNAGNRLVLNEDQIIIKKTNNDFYAYSTPFAYLCSSPMKLPVGGIFMLEKSKRFRLTSISPKYLIQGMWHENERYTYFLPKKYRIESFNLLTDLCFSAPVYRMQFPKDYVDWDAIQSAMK